MEPGVEPPRLVLVSRNPEWDARFRKALESFPLADAGTASRVRFVTIWTSGVLAQEANSDVRSALASPLRHRLVA